MTTKLSEAMREGAKLKPQGYGDFFSYYHEQFCTCALGAAADFICAKRGDGEDAEFQVNQILKEEWGGILYDSMADNDTEYSDLFVQIARKNDDDLLTREEIANWLEQQGY